MSSVFLKVVVFNMSRLKSPVMMISCAFESKARPMEFSIESSTAGRE